MLHSGRIFKFYCIFSCFSLIAISKNSTESQEQSSDGSDLLVQSRMVTYCTLPSSTVGYCIQLSNCLKLRNQINNKTEDNFRGEFVVCGPKNHNRNDPLVCCPNYLYKKNPVPGKNLLPKECGHQNVSISGRILGGKEAKIGEFPWLARLIHRNKAGSKTFGCTGFLIAQKFVLTAAHCLDSNQENVFGPVSEVRLGEHNVKTKTDCNSKATCSDKIQIIKIKNTTIHNSYNGRQNHNDIGLIYLKKEAKFTSFVYPICIPEKPFNASEYWLSGWGDTEQRINSPIKLKVAVPPYPHQNCSLKYKKLTMKIINNQICAGGEKNKDSCSGDSGGPLMYKNGTRWFAAGVVSYGLDCGREGWPAIYTRISSYSDWIKKNMSKLQKKGNKKKISQHN